MPYPLQWRARLFLWAFLSNATLPESASDDADVYLMRCPGIYHSIAIPIRVRCWCILTQLRGTAKRGPAGSPFTAQLRAAPLLLAFWALVRRSGPVAAAHPCCCACRYQQRCGAQQFTCVKSHTMATLSQSAMGKCWIDCCWYCGASQTLKSG